jgi:hypothetical protein
MLFFFNLVLILFIIFFFHLIDFSFQFYSSIKYLFLFLFQFDHHLFDCFNFFLDPFVKLNFLLISPLNQKYFFVFQF